MSGQIGDIMYRIIIHNYVQPWDLRVGCRYKYSTLHGRVNLGARSTRSVAVDIENERREEGPNHGPSHRFGLHGSSIYTCRCVRNAPEGRLVVEW